MQDSIICPLCQKNPSIITDKAIGEMACGRCGLVISDRIQETGLQEGHSFGLYDINDKMTRTGMSVFLARHDMGLSTSIGSTDKDANGHKLDRSIHNKMDRLRKWNLRSQIYSPNGITLYRTFNELHRLRDKLGLSDAILEKTAYIFRKAKEKELIHGRASDAMLAAAIYIACREMESPKTLTDITTMTNMKRKIVSRGYRLLVTELDIKIPLVDPMKYIAKVANKSNLSEKTKRKAICIMHGITTNNIFSGKNPMSFAASVLYLASRYTGENKTQADIACAAGLTEVTIRNRYRDLKRLGLHL
jgi:transcription initiation factor TFIIB